MSQRCISISEVIWLWLLDILQSLTTRVLRRTSTRQGAEIISAGDRLRRPEDRLRPVFPEQRIADLRPANLEPRAAAVYCGCINGAVLDYLVVAVLPAPPPPSAPTTHVVLLK